VSTYERLERVEALLALLAAIDEAICVIGNEPQAGLPFPRPYPHLGRKECFWIKSGRYWFAYRIAGEPVVIGVFYDQADIPTRL